jgi:polar amino acid transport system substrate-binding protein
MRSAPPLFSVLVASALLGLLLAAGPAEVSAETSAEPPTEDRILENGWYFWYPYQYEENRRGLHRVTGMDVEIVRELASRTGRTVAYREIPWKEHVESLRTGQLDIAAGATFTEERAEFVHYSEPYRFEENYLFTLRKQRHTWDFINLDQFLRELRRDGQRLAVVEGYVYGDSRVNRFIRDPANAGLLVETPNDQQSLRLLLEGKVDGFLADRAVGASIVTELGVSKSVLAIPLGIAMPLHLMFSKATVPPEVVEEFNEAIAGFVGTPSYRNLVGRYLLPVIFRNTVESPAFKAAKFVGQCAFALSGVLLAIQLRSTLLAAFVFAFLPTFGGTVLRQLLSGQGQVTALTDAPATLLVISIVLLGFLLNRTAGDRIGAFCNRLVPGPIRARTSQNFYFLVTDALGLAALTVVGVFGALLARVEPIWLWVPIFAVINGAGGGVLRDLVARKEKITAFSGAPYAEWSLLWGGLLGLYLYLNLTQLSDAVIGWGVVGTMAGVFFCRLLGRFVQLPNLFFVLSGRRNSAREPSS